VKGLHAIEELGDGEIIQPPPHSWDNQPGWTGPLLQAAGAVALIVSLILMIALPVLRLKLTNKALVSLERVTQQVHGLVEIVHAGADSLALAQESLSEVGDFLQVTQGTLEESGPFLDSIAQLLGTDAPATLEATQGALAASQGGAAAIDSTLRTLSLLGPLTGVRYDPENSLSDSLAETAQTLDPLPDALRAVEQDLVAVQDQLDQIPASMEMMHQDLAQFAGDLGGLSESFHDRAVQMDEFLVQLERASEGIQRGSWWAMIAMELLFLWNTILAIIVLSHGREMRIRSHDL